MTGPLRRVIAFIWRKPFRAVRAERFLFSLEPRTDGKKGRWWIHENGLHYTVEPMFELLECGHRKLVPKDRSGMKYYNRRRRCKECALIAMATPPWEVAS